MPKSYSLFSYFTYVALKDRSLLTRVLFSLFVFSFFKCHTKTLMASTYLHNYSCLQALINNKYMANMQLYSKIHSKSKHYFEIQQCNITNVIPCKWLL